jgi:hypothetical protein
MNAFSPRTYWQPDEKLPLPKQKHLKGHYIKQKHGMFYKELLKGLLKQYIIINKMVGTKGWRIMGGGQ